MELRKNAQKGVGDDNSLKERITELGELKESYRIKTGFDYEQKYNQNFQSDDNEGKIKRIREQQTLDEVNFMEDMKNRNAQAEIDAMDEGEEKKLAQLKFNHQKEIDELKNLKQTIFKRK
ncbi:hypothetical protein SFC43_31460 [Bacteroides sp. CR5/BHMF/2]|nr:hypothetical protein [Bacteroides sp. CR5/BHMF/2]